MRSWCRRTVVPNGDRVWHALRHVRGTERDALIVCGCSVLGQGMFAACIAFFAIVSISDPGRITSETALTHTLVYEWDGVLFSRRLCGTCDLVKPARSKHCRACDG